MGRSAEAAVAVAGGPAGVAAVAGKKAVDGFRRLPGPVKYTTGTAVGLAGVYLMAQIYNGIPHASASSTITGHTGKGNVTKEFVIPNGPECLLGWDNNVVGAQAKWTGKLTLSQGGFHVSTPGIVNPTVTAKSNKKLTYENVGCLDTNTFDKQAITYDPNKHTETATISLGDALHIFVTRTDPTQGISVVNSRTANIGAAGADILGIAWPGLNSIGSGIDGRLRGIVDLLGQYTSVEGCFRSAWPGLNTAVSKMMAGSIHKQNYFNDPKVTADNVHVNFVAPSADQLISYTNLHNFQQYVAQGASHHVELTLPPVNQLACSADKAGQVVSQPLQASPLGGS